MFALIKTLTELSGPVGQEGVVLDAVERLWREQGATVARRRIGNVIARAGGAGPKVLLVAHADELCFLVRAIHPDGYLWLANGQNWVRTTSFRNAFTIGQRVRVLARSGEIPGVIATVTGHLATIALPEPTELTWSDFWVDTGLSRDELAARGVTPGTRVIWGAGTEQFGAHVVGKALDDRVPLAVLTEVLRRLAPEELGCQLTLACTVQEEIGLIGASALAAEERVDAAIAVEVGMAGDIPGVEEQDAPLRLGAGPALVHKDSLVHYDHALTRRLEQVAAEANIPIQHAVFGSFGSDGAAFMRAGTPTALVAFPTRYTHTPFEMGHLGDIEALVDWLCAFVRAGPE
ncbi:MAG TPA: M20/M25/M40 family metallo-hydrolase [Ardenticatenaceae bacterium]|nr:M20/M25/M40 family metallo-hydrolase [Ardenticatenaceae bacterium]